MYNRLPQRVVDLKPVESVQTCLQCAVAKMASDECENWQELLSVKDRVSNIAVFQSRFLVRLCLPRDEGEEADPDHG